MEIIVTINQTEGLERGGLSKAELLSLANEPKKKKILTGWRSRDMVVEAILERKLILI